LAPSALLAPRLGLVVTRRFGKAARRVRMKRLLREFFRRHKARLPSQDMVIMAKKGAEVLTYDQVAEELGRLLLAPDKDAVHD
jgi:ribonuclease P protein component